MEFEKLYKLLEKEPPYRTKQVEQAVFGLAVEDWSEATTLPKGLRETLRSECPLDIKIEELREEKKTLKCAFNFNADIVEAVLMRHARSSESDKPGRNTACLSSQAGCPLKCDFCLTGQTGFKRSLSQWEIIEQALYFKRCLKKSGGELANIVFMGMGEPFLNYESVAAAIRIINDPDKFNIGARKISVSTVGIIPEIGRFAKDFPQCNLALSLHSANDGLRDKLVPVNRKYPIKALLRAVRKYQEATNRRVMIEYVMLDKINDSVEAGKELAGLLKSSLSPLFMVNLIKYNETQAYRASGQDKINKFKNILLREGLAVVERYRFGDNIKAACGQLAGRER